MFYLFQVFLVVSIPIFVLAGAVLLTMIVWTEAKDYARAKLAMRRINAAAGAQRLRIYQHPVI